MTLDFSARSSRGLLGLALLASLAFPLAAQQPAPTGPDYLINTYTTRWQREPKIAIDSTGEFIVVWQSNGAVGDDSGFSVQARRLDREGAPVGDQFMVNTVTTNSQINPDVAVGPDDRFLVVWEGFRTIDGRWYDAEDNALGEPFQIRTATATASVTGTSVAVHDSGAFMVVWGSSAAFPDDPDGSVQGRVYGPDGLPIGSQFTVNANVHTHESQYLPRVATYGSDEFIVVWQSRDASHDTDGLSIQATVVEADGDLSTRFEAVNQVTSDDQRNPDVAGLPDHRFVIVWQSRFSSAGDDLSHESIQARIFGSGDEEQFQVNTYTSNGQTIPTVTAKPDGDFVVAWSSWGSTGTDSDRRSVQAQVFSSDGSTIGSEVQVNSATTNDQSKPAVAIDAAGDWIAAWETDDEESLEFNIRARRFRVTGDVGNFVWSDDNADGVQDPGEPGLEGITVQLFEELGTPVATAITDANGFYAFEKLEPRDYFLDVELPAGAVFSPMGAGADGAVDSDVDTDGETGTFSVLPAQVVDIDAGIVLPALGGRLWEDVDGDGLQEVGERGIRGLAVRLLDAGGVEVALTESGEDGVYAFRGMPGGDYRIRVAASALAFSPRDVGADDSVDSDVDPTSGESALFSYVESTESLGHDAGLIPLLIFRDGFESGDVGGWSMP